MGAKGDGGGGRFNQGEESRARAYLRARPPRATGGSGIDKIIGRSRCVLGQHPERVQAIRGGKSMTIRKGIRVERSPEIVFRVFTEEIGKWWPLKEGFSFGREKAKDIFIEGRVGGRFFERFTDGTEFDVGRITAFQPPHVVAFTWKAPEWEAPTEVEVKFAPDGTGTRVEVEHRGWDAGPIMQKQGQGYSDGWGIILVRFTARAAAP